MPATLESELWEDVMRGTVSEKQLRLVQARKGIEPDPFLTKEATELKQAITKKLLVQNFEGTVLEVNDQIVTVAFEMNDRREVRSFPRTQLQAAELRTQDVVELQCKLVLVPPTRPLSDDEVEQWERDHVDLKEAQAKAIRPKSLLEDE